MAIWRCPGRELRKEGGARDSNSTRRVQNLRGRVLSSDRGRVGEIDAIFGLLHFLRSMSAKENWIFVQRMLLQEIGEIDILDPYSVPRCPAWSVNYEGSLIESKVIDPHRVLVKEHSRTLLTRIECPLVVTMLEARFEL